MRYPFVTLNDETEITFTNVLDDGSVNVWIETPCEEGFHDISCDLPAFKWSENHGYSEKEVVYLKNWIETTAPLILKMANEKSGGDFDNGELKNAANF